MKEKEKVKVKVKEVDLVGTGFHDGGRMYIIGDYFVDYFDNLRPADPSETRFRYVKKNDVRRALMGRLEYITTFIGVGDNFSDHESEDFHTGPRDEDEDDERVQFHIGCKEFDKHGTEIIRRWANAPDKRSQFWTKVVASLGAERVTASGLHRIPNPEDRAAIREALKSNKKAKRVAA